MTLPSLSYFVGIKLTLKLRDTPATTKTIWLTDRYNRSTLAYTTFYWPIIKDVSDLGVEMGEYLPSITDASFTIDNSPGSFGAGRKFSDLLERYEIIEQACDIYIDPVTLKNGCPAFGAGDLVYSGKVVSVESDMDSDFPTLNFNVSVDPMPDKYIGMQIQTDDDYGITSDNNTSIGKWLPVAVGNYTYLPAYPITDFDTEDSPSFGVAANFSSSYEHTISGVYAQDTGGNWCLLEDISSAYAQGAETASLAIDSDLVNGQTVWAIKNASAQNGVITGVSFAMDPNGTGGRTSQCELTATLFEVSKDGNNLQVQTLTSGKVALQNYDTQNNAGTAFTAVIRFERAVVINSAVAAYAIGVQQTGYATLEAGIFKCETNTCNRWDRTLEGKYVAKGAQVAPVMTCHFVHYHASGSYGANADGFCPAVIYLDQTSSVWPIDKFASLKRGVICKVTGIKDTPAGTLSSSANSPLTRPDWFLKCVSQTWSGTAWAIDTTRWDWTTYATQYASLYDASGFLTRRLIGYQDPPVTLRDVCEAVCRDSASRIGINNSGKLFLWPWGVEYTPSADIPPADIRPETWSVSEAASVINRVSIAYGNENLDVVYVRNKKQKLNFAATIDRTTSRIGAFQAGTNNSVTLYGYRFLKQTDSNYIGDSISAATLSDSFFVRYVKPKIIVTFLVPYDAYKAVKQLDTIRFQHPAFPSYFRSDSRAEEPVQDGASAVRTNLKCGHYWHRMKRYRGLVEGRTIVKPASQSPQIRLTIQLLQNYPNDPT